MVVLLLLLGVVLCRTSLEQRLWTNVQVGGKDYVVSNKMVSSFKVHTESIVDGTRILALCVVLSLFALDERLRLQVWILGLNRIPILDLFGVRKRHEWARKARQFNSLLFARVFSEALLNFENKHAFLCGRIWKGGHPFYTPKP